MEPPPRWRPDRATLLLLAVDQTVQRRNSRKAAATCEKRSLLLLVSNEGGRGVKCGLRCWLGPPGALVVASGAQVSIAPWVWGSGEMGGVLRRRISKESRQAARRKPAPAGAKGWLRVSMCQIASVSLRERSIW